jgi:uncharacterized membrane protein
MIISLQACVKFIIKNLLLSNEYLFDNHHAHSYNCQSNHGFDSVILKNIFINLPLCILFIFFGFCLFLFFFTFCSLSFHFVHLYGQIIYTLTVLNFIDTSESLKQSNFGDKYCENSKFVLTSK